MSETVKAVIQEFHEAVAEAGAAVENEERFSPRLLERVRQTCEVAVATVFAEYVAGGDALRAEEAAAFATDCQRLLTALEALAADLGWTTGP